MPSKYSLTVKYKCFQPGKQGVIFKYDGEPIHMSPFEVIWKSAPLKFLRVGYNVEKSSIG
jgi:hypothetical protein